MKVETFEITELDTSSADSFEVDTESLEIIESLALEGQKVFYSSSPDEVDVKTVIPFKEMTQTELAVYRILYPEAVSPSSYRACPIPLRVLRLLKLYLPHFKEISVWGPRTHNPDPILIGVLEGERSWQKHYFLLARWGEALESFDILFENAKEILRKSWFAKAEESIAKCQAFKAAPDGYLNRAFNGETIYEPFVP